MRERAREMNAPLDGGGGRTGWWLMGELAKVGHRGRSEDGRTGNGVVMK